MKAIYKNIRKTNLLDGLIALFFAMVASLFCIFMFSNYVQEDYKGNLGMMFIIVIVGCFVIVRFIKACKGLFIAIAPSKCSVFGKYNNIPQIYNEIYNTILYEDNSMIVSENYITSTIRVDALVACDDVIAVYKKKTKMNRLVFEIAIVIIDKFGDKMIHRFKKDIVCNSALYAIAPMCKNAAFGYSRQTLKHVKKNVITSKKFLYNLRFRL